MKRVQYVRNPCPHHDTSLWDSRKQSCKKDGTGCCTVVGALEYLEFSLVIDSCYLLHVCNLLLVLGPINYEWNSKLTYTYHIIRKPASYTACFRPHRRRHEVASFIEEMHHTSASQKVSYREPSAARGFVRPRARGVPSSSQIASEQPPEGFLERIIPDIAIKSSTQCAFQQVPPLATGRCSYSQREGRPKRAVILHSQNQPVH